MMLRSLWGSLRICRLGGRLQGRRFPRRASLAPGGVLLEDLSWIRRICRICRIFRIFRIFRRVIRIFRKFRSFRSFRISRKCRKFRKFRRFRHFRIDFGTDFRRLSRLRHTSESTGSAKGRNLVFAGRRGTSEGSHVSQTCRKSTKIEDHSF